METDADIDAAAEDPPLLWLAVAVAGLGLAGAGLIAVVIDLLGYSGLLLDPVPLLAPLFTFGPLAAVLGVALFLFAMTEWSPDLDT